MSAEAAMREMVMQKMVPLAAATKENRMDNRCWSPMPMRSESRRLEDDDVRIPPSRKERRATERRDAKALRKENELLRKKVQDLERRGAAEGAK